MRSTHCKKKWFLLFSVLISGFIFLGFNSSFFEYNKFPKPLVFPNNILNPDDKDLNVTIFETNTWIFNNNIMQYSTMIGVNSKKEVEIQAIVLTKRKFENYLRCLVWSNNLNFVNTSVIDVFKMNEKFWQIFKVKCVVGADELSNSSSIFVAVIDSRDYANRDKSLPTKIFAQRPTFYDLQKKKEPGVTNCVHMLRDVDSARYKKILNWAEINKQIGLSRTTLYHIDQNKTTMNMIREKYPNFIHVIDYEYDLNKVCSRLELHGLKNCSQLYGFLFKGELFNLHERVCTNECKFYIFLLKLKKNLCFSAF